MHIASKESGARQPYLNIGPKMSVMLPPTLWLAMYPGPLAGEPMICDIFLVPEMEPVPFGVVFVSWVKENGFRGMGSQTGTLVGAWCWKRVRIKRRSHSTHGRTAKASL